MARLHVICRRGLHLQVTSFPVFESGYWLLGEEEARRLQGGMLYLHETKSKRSYFGGMVRGWRISGLPGEPAGRIVLEVRSEAAAKGIPWQGADHSMAWSGGVLD